MNNIAPQAEHSDLIGGSTCERVMACHGSVEMMRKTPKRPSSAYADQGSMLHAVMDIILMTEETAQDLVARKFTAFGHELTAELVEEMVEPALEQLDRLVSILDDGEIDYISEARVRYMDMDAFGTSDLIANTTGGEYVIVDDWKFGRGKTVVALGNKQWRFYAGAARECYPEWFLKPDGTPRLIVGAITQPAMDEPLTYEIITSEELDEFVAEMKAAVKAIIGGSNELNPGKHCLWCSPICTARRSGVQELLTRTLPTDPIVDPDLLGELVAMAEEAEGFIKSIMQLAHEELEKGRAVTGQKLVAKRATRQWIDEAKAEAELRKLKFKVGEITTSKLLSPAATEKLFKAKKMSFDAMNDLVEARSSGTTMAAESDPRPAVKSKFDGSPLNLPTKPEEGN